MMILRVIVVVTGALYGTIHGSAQTIHYVNVEAAGANDGSSWADAFTDLQDALAAAQSSDQIWVVQGTYKPGPPDAGPEVSFHLVSGVALYGGFAGDETALDHRDWEKNETILSGLLVDEPWPDDVRVLNVVTGHSLSEQVILDGVTIRDGGPNFAAAGGGLWLVDSDVLLTNCLITSNQADRGGGLFMQSGTLTAQNTTFQGNTAWGPEYAQGGGLFADSADLILQDCTFASNAGFDIGASIAVVNSSLTIQSSIFRDHCCGTVINGLIYSENSVIEINDSKFIDNGSGAPAQGCLTVADSEVTVSDTLFMNNHFDGAAVLGAGNSQVTFHRCTMIDNGVLLMWGDGLLSLHDTSMTTELDDGAAIWWTGDGEIIRSEVVGFHDSWIGGGLCWSGGHLVIEGSLIAGNGTIGCGGISFSGESFAIVNSVVRNNINYSWTAGGIEVAADNISIVNTTITNNFSFDGIGGLSINAGSSATLANAIIWGNGDWAGPFQFSGPVEVTHTLLQSDEPWPGEGNINVDPLFADDEGRLSANSPAIDSGNNDFIPLEITTDLDGNPRIMDGTGAGQAIVDMGAFEFQPPCIGDLTGDGMVNGSDLMLLLAAWGQCDECPPLGENCPADLTGDCTINGFDLLALLGNWGLCR